jgi:LysM repeat protein
MNRIKRLTFFSLSLALLTAVRGADATSDDVATLKAENKQLSTELATAWKELDVVKGDLAAAQATAAKAADDSVALHKQLEATRAAGDTDRLKQQVADLQAKLDAANQDAVQAKTDLAAAQATAKNYSDEIAALKTAAAEAKVAPAPDAALQKENEDLKAQLASAKSMYDEQSTQLNAAKEELAAKPAPTASATAAPVASDDDTKKKLDDTQEKLEMSLHSYSLLQDENAELKKQLAQSDSDKANAAAQLDAANSAITSLKAQAEVAKQVDSLRTQLRQTQDELASLASANEQLRTKLALSSPMNTNLRPTPLRPGSPAAELTQTPVAAAPEPTAVPPATTTATTPDASAGPRTYVVAEGDTLSKIAQKFYGTASKWDVILKANHDVLKNDKSLRIGSTLKIP